MKAFAFGLAALGLTALLFIGVLLVDGVRSLLARRLDEARRRPLDLVVRKREEVAGHLICLSLEHPRGARLPAFEAGQHVVLFAPAGRDGREIRRAYSLAAWRAGAPRGYELGIKREQLGALSSWAWDHLREGARVRVLPPRGEFVVGPPAAELVLVGGGIGITPMRAMLHAALAAPSQFDRVVLFHAARHPQELLYRAEFEHLAQAHDQLSYLPIVSRPDAAWTGASGRLDAARLLMPLRQSGAAQFYLCAGAEVMAALRQGLMAAGIGEANIHWEAFGVAPGETRAGQRVTLANGQGFETAGEPSLLAALEAHGAAPESDCRAGTCGLCRMQLRRGEVKWLLAPGCALGPGEILPCVCQAVDDLQFA
ncbi:MAG: hypothetical protein CVU25_05820 [Betaproteobacteria bacterium HGW-Betaproteobacteria-19]|nr:MAG: hypothetical protein CVU25_05820 [Betaproteobacteria bacterium HGW-Betaproteobacteria-19]